MAYEGEGHDPLGGAAPSVRDDADATRDPAGLSAEEMRGLLRAAWARQAELEAQNEVLRLSEEKVGSIFRASPAGIGVVRNRIFVEVNDALCRVLGYAREELLGQCSRMVYLNDEDFEYVGREMYRHVAEGETPTVEISWRRRDGGVIHILLSLTPIRLSDPLQAVTFAVLDVTQRKKAENALRESEARLAKSQEIAHVGTWVHDHETQTLVWTDEVYRIFGEDPQDFTVSYEAFLAAVHPDDRARVQAVYQQSLEDGRDTYEIEHRVVHRRTGEVRYVHERCEHVKDAGGRVVRSVGMVQDITDRTHAEHRLQQSRDQLDLALRVAQMGYWRAEVGSGLMDLSSMLDEFLGRHHGRSVRTVYDFAQRIHPEDRPAAVAGFERTAVGGVPLDITYRICRTSGEIRWLRSLGSLVRSDDDSPAFLLGVARDITDERCSEQRQAALLNGLRGVLGAADELIGLADLDDLYRRAVELARERLGLGRCALFLLDSDGRSLVPTYGTDAEGRTVDERGPKVPVPPEWDEFVTPKVATAQRWRVQYDAPLYDRGELVGHGELGMALVQAGQRVVGVLFHDNRVAGARLDETTHEVVAIYCSLVGDVVDRRGLEQQIQRTQKLESLGVLAGGIAHDFNNILMAVLGYAELALRQISPVSPACNSIKGVEVAAQRAAELCQQMLAYAGKAAFTQQTVSLQELIEETAHLLRMSISKKAVLNLNLEPGLPPVFADAGQIRQIAMNLIINASEAIGDRSGVITLSVGATRCDEEYLQRTELRDDLPPGLYIHLEVADTGCGMDAATRSRIFDPFFSTKFTGRGLGLAAVLGIVRAHRGAVKVYSEPGRGTTFKVLFPAMVDRVGAGHEQQDPRAEEWHGEGTLLLVDDEESLRALGAAVLKDLGFTVITAADGREAVEIYRERRSEIALVLLDLTMPRMDGAEAFGELRRLNPAVRVVLTSGYSKEDISARFAGKGLAGVLQKPYTYDGLRGILASVLPAAGCA